MNYLRQNYAGKPVIFMTPARCYYGNLDDLKPSTRANKLPDAKALIAYVEVIEETAKQFDIPVLNLYHKLGLDPHDPEIAQKYTSDGLHFNDAGHEFIAKRLCEFIESL
jgi:lysophospholipase L1-like esterase